MMIKIFQAKIQEHG